MIRDIPVTTFGCPFYSGWGLTSERQPNARRTRKLTVNEVFAAAYILYPKYYSLTNRQEISLKEAIYELSNLKKAFHMNDYKAVERPLSDKEKIQKQKEIEKQSNLEYMQKQNQLAAEKKDILLERKQLEIEEIKLDIAKRKKKLESNLKNVNLPN